MMVVGASLLLLAVAAWTGAPIGALVGVLSSVILWTLLFGVANLTKTRRDVPRLAAKVAIVSGLWFGSGVGSRVVSGSDWHKVSDWYFASLSITVGVLVGPLAVATSYKLMRRILVGT